MKDNIKEYSEHKVNKFSPHIDAKSSDIHYLFRLIALIIGILPLFMLRVYATEQK